MTQRPSAPPAPKIGGVEMTVKVSLTEEQMAEFDAMCARDVRNRSNMVAWLIVRALRGES